MSGRPTAADSVNLDFLRAVAVLCVFGSHVYAVLTRRPTELTHHIGQLGVIMFFVHTSLVLMGSLQRSRRWGWALVAEFFVHRAFRIYPLAVVCVLIAALLPDAQWTARQLAANLTLTQNLLYEESMVGGLWTLPIEVQMYVALPFLFIAFRTRAWYWLLGVWLLALVVGTVQSYVSGRLVVLSYAPCFLPGLIAWKLGRRATLPGWLWPLGMLLAALPWLASAGNQMEPRWLTCLLLGLAIPWFREMPWRWLNAASHTLAQYSYGIYLTHYAALMVAFRQMGDVPFAGQVLAFAAMATLWPYLAFHLVERPMMALGRRVGGRVADAVAARSARRAAGVPA
ncbi:acyltransferase family protein [Pseudoduganella flava]|nr:acyltransferase [Pseudoduganella flava]